MPTRNVPTELLRTLIILAEVRSFTRAARVQGISQPAVSAQIKRLQDIFGYDLFDRSAPGVVFTQKGQAILSKARDVITIIDDLKRLHAPHADAMEVWSG